MVSKLLVLTGALALSLACAAQVRPAAEQNPVRWSAGGGVDYWKGDWGSIARFGPSAWISAEIWHGLGLNAEGHSMMFGGDSVDQQYKYFVGEGGLMYTYHFRRRFAPYAKGEMGFAGLSFPHKPTSTYTHDTRNTWAIGGGLEYKLVDRVWLRADFTYDGFPDFYSPITHNHPTLNPAGVVLGATYHFR